MALNLLTEFAAEGPRRERRYVYILQMNNSKAEPPGVRTVRESEEGFKYVD